MRMLSLLLLVAAFTSKNAFSQAAFCPALKAMTLEPAVASAHWGISVTAADGTSLCSLNDHQLFQPASNAKLFTTAAALSLLGPKAQVQTTVSSSATLVLRERIKGNLVLFGRGDANLSGRTFPFGHAPTDPLAWAEDLAAQVAVTGLTTVEGDVLAIGDHLGYEPYPPGWALEDLVWGYGAPVSALSVEDNELKLTIRPGAESGDRAVLTLAPALPYYTVVNEVITADPATSASIAVDRLPGSKLLRIHGRIGLHAAPEVETLAIDDPAEFAAAALKQALEHHGVTITGKARTEHAPIAEAKSFRATMMEPMKLPALGSSGVQEPTGAASDCSTQPCHPVQNQVLATRLSPALLEDITATNKESLNLHAELLIRRLGEQFGGGSITTGTAAQGARVVRQFLIDAGINGSEFALYDGSGLSIYDLVTPHATTQLLHYAQSQPWGAGWRASLPVGGVDGTLAARLTAAPLKGHVSAKTGTTSEVRALSGYVTAASGQDILFSILVNNHLPGSTADRAVMDRIVALIAAAN